jgi:hypothetical protein
MTPAMIKPAKSFKFELLNMKGVVIDKARLTFTSRTRHDGPAGQPGGNP